MTGAEEQSVQWGPEMEVSLFYAMRKHKPVGINKNFHMMCIFEKLAGTRNMKITSQQIWEHLGTMYDMSALHESEVIPFPNREENFKLPESEYGDLIKEKVKEKTSTNDDEKKEAKGKTSSSQTNTPSEKDGAKRKRTRQSAGTPNESSSTKRRR